MASKGLNDSSSSYSRVTSLGEGRPVMFQPGGSVSRVTAGAPQTGSFDCGAGSQRSLWNCGRLLNDSAPRDSSGSSGGGVQCSETLAAKTVVRTGDKSSVSSNAADDTEKRKLAQQYHILQG